MRFIIANEFYQQMLQQPEHTVDCYVRPGEYLHHMYIDGVKYAVAPAVLDCLAQAEAEMDAAKFVRIHRSYLLNLDCLARIETGEGDTRFAILNDGRRLPVSRAGYARLSNRL